MKEDRVLIYIEGSEDGERSERVYTSVYESENPNLFNKILKSGNFKCLTGFPYKDQVEEKYRTREEIREQVSDLLSRVNLSQALLPISLDFILDENGHTDEYLENEGVIKNDI